MARQIFETRYPDAQLLKTVLAIFAEAIQEVDRYSRDSWVVQIEGDVIQLVLGHYLVLMTWENGVWLSLDKQLLEDERYSPSLASLRAWGLQPDDPNAPGSYPAYMDKSRRTEFSVNGYYQIGQEHPIAWPHIRRFFIEFIYKATYHGQPMDPHSRNKHASGVLKYIRNELGVNVPDPSNSGIHL